MEINTMIGCRVDCDFCPQPLLMDKYSSHANIENVSYGNPSFMSFETFKICLDKMPKLLRIIFSGYAEPFLNPECIKMIIYTHNSGRPVEIFSTLVGLKLEDIDQFKHIPFTSFHIHLPDAKMFAKIAVNKNYIAVLKKLLTSDIKNLRAMTMGPLHPKIKEILGTDIEPSEMISRAGNVEIVKNNFKRKLGPLVCNRGSSADLEDRLDVSVLLPNGDVSLCGQDYGLQNILGNLLKTDYVSLFQSDTFKKIREKMKSHDSDIICRNCHEAMPESELIERRKIKNDYTNDKTALSIIHLYQKLLQRYPDKVGFDHFYSKISNNELTIQGLEDMISQSAEYTNTRPIKLGLKHFS